MIGAVVVDDREAGRAGLGWWCGPVHVTVLVKFLADYKELLQGARQWPYTPGYVGKIVRSGSVDDKTKELARSLLSDELREGASISSDEVKTGVVRNWKEGYGFISHPDFPGNLFFHHSSIDGNVQVGQDNLAGRRVEFTAPKSSVVDKPRADWVRLLSD
jgi:cold shock CspA family protein